MLRYRGVTDEDETDEVIGPDEDRFQLSLPLPGMIEKPPHGMSIPRAERVYANRNLHMAGIDWIGFDMDYTLAIYRQEAMDALSIRLAAERLVKRGYPESLKQLAFDARFPIRGLLVDKKYGNILKMDRHKVVNQGFHGMEKLTQDKLKELYGTEKIHPKSDRFHWIDTLFALCEVTCFAAVTALLEAEGQEVDYQRLFDDIRAAVDEAHADGSVYQHVTTDFDKYVERDDDLARALHKLRSSGKRLFLLTNSPYHYTEQVMTYLLGGGTERYQDWKQYFDVTICSSKKPLWFQPTKTSEAPLPFYKRTPDLDARAPAVEVAKGNLERGVVYEGGCLPLFEQRLNLQGPRVLYVGDHIYGDILRSKKDSTWRTALVLQELDQEIAALAKSDASRVRRRQLAESRPYYEDELRYYAATFKEVSRSGLPLGPDEKLRKDRAKAHIDRVRTALSELEVEYEALQGQINECFHPYFGSLLKEMNGLSIFGQQVEQYADIYMRRVSALGVYSPTQFFRSPHDLMPHEI